MVPQMTHSSFKQVDVFTSEPFKGNPVAVFMDAKLLTSEEMQNIAKWTNLSETTFILPPNTLEADYRVRIFTPGRELPFAGHPTIGTAHALLESGLITAKKGKIVQECDAGLITLIVKGNEQGHYSIAFELPTPIITPLGKFQIDTLEEILGCAIDRQLTPALVDVGARWIVLKTHDAEAVLATKPNFNKLAIHDKELGITGICIYGYYKESTDFKIEVRTFAPACGVNEDPVCGSGNGSVAAFMKHHGLTLQNNEIIQSTQGQVLGRAGSIELHFDNDKIFVGGNAITCIEGKISL